MREKGPSQGGEKFIYFRGRNIGQILTDSDCRLGNIRNKFFCFMETWRTFQIIPGEQKQVPLGGGGVSEKMGIIQNLTEQTLVKTYHAMTIKWDSFVFLILFT